MTSEAKAQRASEIAEQIGLKFFCQEDLTMQGAVLGEMVAIWVATHQPRDAQIQRWREWLEMVTAMVPHKEAIMRDILAALYRQNPAN